MTHPDPGSSLADWLSWIERLHPTTMELTLDRVSQVAQRLRLFPLAAKVVTVAGTNGKGSTVRLLEAALCAAGLGVGSTTSPHVLSFNERIRIGGIAASDADIMAAFRAVAEALGEITLTYYEYAVVAAFWLMHRAQVDVALLEVGLGGRLDAVNILDADIAVVTHIGIDHVAILGDNRDSIGAEKAGIFRAGQLGIVGDPNPPASVLACVAKLAVRLHQRNLHFTLDTRQQQLVIGDKQLSAQPSRLALDNILTALAVVHYGFPDLMLEAAYRTMCDTELLGRMQRVDGNIWLDVAHNPDGARHLASELGARCAAKRVHCLYATLEDKDAVGFVGCLQSLVDAWYIGATTGRRAKRAGDLAQELSCVHDMQVLAVDENWDNLMQQAVIGKDAQDALLICGSFESVTRATAWLATWRMASA